MICVQIRLICNMLQDSNCRIVPDSRWLFNRLYREQWDEIRDFLALHYKFSRRLDTPFWRFCRESCSLGDVQPLVDLYQREGPVRACQDFVPRHSTFNFEGYLIMLICQRVPTA
jgi:tryptophan halogenase